jgi:hypothetical protein
MRLQRLPATLSPDCINRRQRMRYETRLAALLAMLAVLAYAGSGVQPLIVEKGSAP